MARDYKTVVAWQRSHRLTVAVYDHTRQFPSDERFGLTIQPRRASFSVPANNAEGSGRESNRDYLRFLFISLGSLKETEYFLLLARDQGYLKPSEYEALTDQIHGTFSELQGLIKAVKKECGLLGRLPTSLLGTLFIPLGSLFGFPINELRANIPRTH